MTAPDKQNWFFSIDEYKEQYPTKFGTWKLDFDPLQFLPEAHKAYNSSDVKIAGRNNFNKFKSVDDYAKDYLTKYWNDRFGFLYDWKWEYFHLRTNCYYAILLYQILQHRLLSIQIHCLLLSQHILCSIQYL